MFHDTRFELQSKCHEWSATPISAYLRRGPRGYFRSECCTGGESMAAPRVKFPLHSPMSLSAKLGSWLWSRNSSSRLPLQLQASDLFWLRLQNDLVQWRQKNNALFVQLACPQTTVCLWDRNQNFRLQPRHLKVFGSGHSNLLVFRLHSPGWNRQSNSAVAGTHI